MPIFILLADDHHVVREGLKRYLALDPEFEVVGEARDGGEAVALAQALRPDVVLMDLLMPGLSGIEAIRQIRTELADVEVVAVTSVSDPGTVRLALQAGAIGYLLKDTQADVLCRTLRDAAEGRVQLPPAGVQAEILTPREQEVLGMLAAGRSNREIAQATGITERTVKAHVGSILAKMGLKSRTQAALEAVGRGWVSRD